MQDRRNRIVETKRGRKKKVANDWTKTLWLASAGICGSFVFYAGPG
jgi:hypothetical protein